MEPLNLMKNGFGAGAGGEIINWHIETGGSSEQEEPLMKEMTLSNSFCGISSINKLHKDLDALPLQRGKPR